jgi:repressor LexA
MNAPAPSLTDTRRAVLAAIVRLTEADGFPPSLLDIANEVGLSSTSSVWHQVSVLLRAGLLRPAAFNRPRVLRLADGVAVSRNGLVARAVTVSRCPDCSLSLPVDHECLNRPEEIPNA